MAIFPPGSFDPLKTIDYKTIKAAAVQSALPVLRRLLPDGKLVRHEYVARNPKRADRQPGSFKINTRTGRWADFATSDRGGDLISLVAYLQDVSQAQAARLLAELLGIDPEVRK